MAWARVRRGLLALVLFFTTTSCSVNILTEFADTTSDDALFYDAKVLINERDYTNALAKFSSMSAAFLAKPEVLALKASAYGGLCGIEFVDFIEALANLGSAPTARLMQWLFVTFDASVATSTTQLANCILAETTIKSIASLAANRTDDENILMLEVALAKMGKILSIYADTNDDGAVDGAYDPCTSPALASNDSLQLATGFNIALDSMSALSSVTLGGGQLDTAVTDAAALCTSVGLCQVPPDVNTAQINNAEENAIKTMVKEDQDIGLGTCAGDYTVCNCP